MIRALTFNVFGHPEIPVLIPRNGRAARIARLREIFRESSRRPDGWDVILLQEVWLREDREAFRDCGYFCAPAESARDGLGLLTLSRHPIEHHAAFRWKKNGSLRYPLNGEFIVGKGLATSRVTPPGRPPVWVTNVHFVAQHWDTSFHPLRARQVDELIAHLRTLPGGDAQLVGGDLNMSHFGPGLDASLARLERELVGFSAWANPDAVSTFCESNALARAGAGTMGQLDHLLSTLTPSAGGRVDLGEVTALGRKIPVSDHYGWETTFKLR